MDLDPQLRGRAMRAPAARLATLRPDGHPHVVPITFVLDGDTIVTAVDHKPKTTTSLQRLKNIDSDSRASVVIDHYEDDWSKLWWVRGDGTAEILAEGAVRQRAVERLKNKYQQYRDSPPDGPVIAVTVTSWRSWSA